MARLLFEEEFALLFPAVGDAAPEFVQRETDGLTVLPYRLYDVRREICQLKRPGYKGASMFSTCAICRMVVALPEMSFAMP